MPQRNEKEIAKIKAKVLKIGIRSDITVKLTSGQTYHGFVNRIDDDFFEMTEVDLKTSFNIRYDEVKNVESGYGEKGPFGNRASKNKRRIGMIVGLVATVVIPVIIVVAAKGGR